MNHEHPVLVRVYNDQLAPVIPVEFQLHTPENPFCYNPSCPCHQDLDTLADVYFFVYDGLMTDQEAENFVAGKMV